MKHLIVYKNISLRNALKKLSVTGEKCLLVIDKKRKLLGTLTDGDIRKALIKNYSLDCDISNIYKRNPFKLFENKFNIFDARKNLIENRLEVIPVVDQNNILKDFILHEKSAINLNNFYKEKIEKNIVIMAGGLGSRLAPLTNVLPKPLLPLNGKTLIEHVIDSYTKWGFKNFKISVNYKSKLLKAFFEEISLKCKFTFVNETKPLGTAGSLHLLKKKFKKHFIVTNCDTVAEIDLNKLLKIHFKEKNIITMVGVETITQIPYGVCKFNSKKKLVNIIEKPKINSSINAGIYICSPEVFRYIKKLEFLNMPDLINIIAAKKKNSIGLFKLNKNLWNDIGRWSEYEKVSQS